MPRIVVTRPDGSPMKGVTVDVIGTTRVDDAGVPDPDGQFPRLGTGVTNQGGAVSIAASGSFFVRPHVSGDRHRVLVTGLNGTDCWDYVVSCDGDGTHETVREMMADFMDAASSDTNVVRTCLICCDEDEDTNITISSPNSSAGSATLIMEGRAGPRSPEEPASKTERAALVGIITNALDSYFATEAVGNSYTPHFVFKNIAMTNRTGAGAVPTVTHSFIYDASNAGHSGYDFFDCHFEIGLTTNSNGIVVRAEAASVGDAMMVRFYRCNGTAGDLHNHSGAIAAANHGSLEIYDCELSLRHILQNNDLSGLDLLRIVGGTITVASYFYERTNGGGITIELRDTNLVNNGATTGFRLATLTTTGVLKFIAFDVHYSQSNNSSAVAFANLGAQAGGAGDFDSVYIDGLYARMTASLLNTGTMLILTESPPGTSTWNYLFLGHIAAQGWTTVMSGGTPAAGPSNAQYLTLAASAGLSAERVFTPRYNLFATDGGAGGAYSVDSWLEGATRTPSGGGLTLGTDGDMFHVAAGNFATITTPTRQQLVLLVYDGVSVITHGTGANAIILQGATNWTTAAGDSQLLMWEGTNWREVNRQLATAAAGTLRVKEVDGAPDVSGVSIIQVSNGTLVDNGGGDVTITTGGGGGGGGHTIRENDVDQTTRAALNFIDPDAGAGLVTDDAGAAETEVHLDLYRLEAEDHDHSGTGLQGGTIDGAVVVNTPAGTIAATDVQAAINELDGDVQGHITDPTDAHDASAVSIVDAGLFFVGADVETALQELGLSASLEPFRIIDQDGDTYVRTESTPGGDEDIIESAIGGTVRSRLSALGLQLANASDFEMYSDAFTTLVASIDGTTGNALFAQMFSVTRESSSALVLGLEGTGAAKQFRYEFPDLTTEDALLRAFRTTATTGAVAMEIFYGDGTNTPIFKIERTATGILRGYVTGYWRVGSSTAPTDTTVGALTAASYNVTTSTELTIATGAITVTQTHHRIDTEANAATDDLDTISGLLAGKMYILRPENAARTVVVKHNTGNIQCIGNADITLDDIQDWIWVFSPDGTTAYVMENAAFVPKIYDAIVDSADADTVGKRYVYATLQAAITAGHQSILFRQSTDVADIIISTNNLVSTSGLVDAVVRIVGDASASATVPVNIRCDKAGVLFDSLTFTSKRLTLNAAQCRAFACIFQGSITPGTAVATEDVDSSETGIDFGSGANGGLTSGYSRIDHEYIASTLASASGNSGSLVATNGRGVFYTARIPHRTGSTITDIGTGHLVIAGENCEITACFFISCTNTDTSAVWIPATGHGARITACAFLSNTTFACVGMATDDALGGPRGVEIVGTKFTGNTCKNAVIHVFEGPDALTGVWSFGLKVNGCSISGMSAGGIHGTIYRANIAGNTIVSGGTNFGNQTNVTDFRDTAAGVLTGMATTDNAIPFDTDGGAHGTKPSMGYVKLSSGEVASFSAIKTGTTSGTATATSATSLTNSGAAWVTDQWLGQVIAAGTSWGIVIANSGTVITVDSWRGGTPGPTALYAVRASLVGMVRGLGSTTAVAAADNQTFTYMLEIAVKLIHGGTPAASSQTNIISGNTIGPARIPLYVETDSHAGAAMSQAGSLLYSGNIHSFVNEMYISISSAIVGNQLGSITIDMRNQAAEQIQTNGGTLTITNAPADAYFLHTSTPTGMASGIRYPANVWTQQGVAAGDLGGLAIPLTNRTTAPSVVADAVLIDTANDNSFVKPAALAGSGRIVGVVVQGSVADGSAALVAIKGVVSVTCTTAGAVARGDKLEYSATAGQAQTAAALTEGTVFARALTAKAAAAAGSVKCVLI